MAPLKLTRLHHSPARVELPTPSTSSGINPLQFFARLTSNTSLSLPSSTSLTLSDYTPRKRRSRASSASDAISDNGADDSGHISPAEEANDEDTYQNFKPHTLREKSLESDAARRRRAGTSRSAESGVCGLQYSSRHSFNATFCGVSAGRPKARRHSAEKENGHWKELRLVYGQPYSYCNNRAIGSPSTNVCGSRWSSLNLLRDDSVQCAAGQRDAPVGICARSASDVTMASGTKSESAYPTTARRSLQARACAFASQRVAVGIEDKDEEDCAIVIEDEDLPMDLHALCEKVSLNSKTPKSQLRRNSPSEIATDETALSPLIALLGEERELAQMRALQRVNAYVPRTALVDDDTAAVAAAAQSLFFVKNLRSGNAVALPCRVAYARAPNSERVKVIVVGKSGVGKTTVVFGHRYGRILGESDTPRDFGVTIGMAYFNLDLRVNGIPLHIQVWDTAGQERFRCMVPMYLRNASAAIAVYDITDRSSFDEVDRYVNEIKRAQSDENEPLVILVGNKCDLEANREVSQGEAQQKAKNLNALFFELAATNTIMVTALLAHIAERIYMTDGALMERLAAAYQRDRGSDADAAALRVLDRDAKPFVQRCCNIH